MLLCPCNLGIYLEGNCSSMFCHVSLTTNTGCRCPSTAIGSKTPQEVWSGKPAKLLKFEGVWVYSLCSCNTG